MIYLNTISTRGKIYVPKNREIDGELTFVVKGTINQSVWTITELNEDVFANYILLDFALPSDIERGEYEYSLMDNSGVISTGLLMAEGVSEMREHYKAIQYEQYE